MALENITAGSTVADLDPNNPASGDYLNQADDHLRAIKKAVQQTFMNVSATVCAVASELDFAHKGGTVSGSAIILGGLNVSATTALGLLHVGGTATFSAPVVFKQAVVMENALSVAADISGTINEALHSISADYAAYATSAGAAISAQYATSAGRANVHNMYVVNYDVIGGTFAIISGSPDPTLSGTSSATGKFCISHQGGAYYLPVYVGSTLITPNMQMKVDTVNWTTTRTPYEIYNMDTTLTASRATSVSHMVILVKA